MKKIIRSFLIAVLISCFSQFKSQTVIVPETPGVTPLTDSTTLLIEKYGLGNVWEYAKILNISRADSLWFKNYKRIVFNSNFISGLVQNINTKNMNDSIVINFSDTVMIVLDKAYIQRRRLTVKWDAEGIFDTYHPQCTHRKIVATDRIQTITTDSTANCTNFTNKLTLFNDKGCNNYRIAFSQAFMEDCAHRVSNYYKYVYAYDPSIDYEHPPVDLNSVINLNISPNPSSGTGVVTVSYYLPEAGNVTLELQNAVTMVTQQVQNVNKPAGNHSKNFNVNNVATGTYYVKLTYQGQTFTRIFIVN